MILESAEWVPKADDTIPSAMIMIQTTPYRKNSKRWE